MTRSKPRFGIETLESREVMAAGLSASLSAGVLAVTGTEQADSIVVRREGDQVLVDNVVKDGVVQTASFRLTDVSRLIVQGLGEADHISVFGDFGRAAVSIDGGAGRDAVFTSLARAVAGSDASDVVAAGDMARVHRRLQEMGLNLGAALTNETAHRDTNKGTVQQFQFGDIRLNGSSGEVYIAGEQGIRKFGINGGAVSVYGTSELEYYKSEFMNYRAAYDLRPTLLVITHGLDGGIASEKARGYSWEGEKLRSTSSADWTLELGANMARELNAAGSMVHVMFVDWASQSPNTSATEHVAGHIKSFLEGRQGAWDVSLIGHSRGGVFSSEVADLLRGHTMDQLQLILLDATAAVSMNDQYPTRKPNAVDHAVAYDDGLTLYPLGGTREGQAISGAEYRRVTVPGVGRFQSTPSHMRLPSYYAGYEDPRDGGPGNPDLTFHRDLDWLLARKTRSAGAFTYDARAGWELVITSPPADGFNYVFDIGFDPNRNGDAVGYISVLGIGSASFTIGKSGLNIGGGVTAYGNAAASFSDQGLVVGINGPGYSPVNVAGQVIIGPKETRLDVDLGPLRVSLFGKDAGLFWGGRKVSFDSIASVRLNNLSLPPGGVAVLLQKGFGATKAEIAKVLSRDLKADLNTIAGVLKDKLGAGLDEVAGILGGTLKAGTRAVAGALGSISRDAAAIAGALKTSLGVPLEGVADALYNGIAWTGYGDVAKGLGSLTRDAGAIAGALKSKLGVSAGTIAEVLYKNITWTGYRDVAKGLASITSDLGVIAGALRDRLGAGFDTVADALYNGISWTGYRDVAKGLGAITRDVGVIAGALKNKLGASMNSVADALYRGISWTGYNDVARGLGSLTRDVGAIASAMRGQLSASVNTIAEALYRGISWTGYRDVAKGLASITSDVSAIAGALKNQLGASLNTVADALYNGISWTKYNDVARGLGSLTRDVGAIASAMRGQLSASFNTIASALYNGISWTGYRDVAKGLGAITRDVGVIAGALRSQLNLSLNTISDALYNGISWTSYQDVARGLGGLTRDAGAIASALRNQLGASFNTIADAMYRAISWTSYDDVARGLRSVTNDARQIASALRNGAGAAASTVTNTLNRVGSGLANLGSALGSLTGGGGGTGGYVGQTISRWTGN